MTDTIRVELHCHSSVSDGDHSPAYVAHSIAAIGAEWAALTDHNSVSGQHQFRTVLEKRGVHSIVGLEIDARSPVGILHILGYGIDPEHQPLLDVLHVLRQPLRTSARYWMERLTSIGSIFPEGGQDAAPARPTPPPEPPATEEAIRLLHEAGGLVFLAHPLSGIGDVDALEEVLSWLQPQGLDGIEAFHKPYPPETQRALLEVALRRGLLTTAGSDFHGVHHSDGASPGVDMPLIHWEQLTRALAYGPPQRPPSEASDQATRQR